MARFLWICAAGAAGTGARYLMSTWISRAAGPAFPWGTLAVNLLGSFLLGAVMEVGLATEILPPTVRLTLSTGLMGGFTTYSSFNYETLQYLQSQSWLLAAVNVGATVLGCLAAGILGIWAARVLAGTWAW
ncbi:MAG TPA: CrcB family protein [Thermoanaerobaculia bacterium]|nr:CrcB family protein [Thermoanaerobaculia bacterium]